MCFSSVSLVGTELRDIYPELPSNYTARASAPTTVMLQVKLQFPYVHNRHQWQCNTNCYMYLRSFSNFLSEGIFLFFVVLIAIIACITLLVCWDAWLTPTFWFDVLIMGWGFSILVHYTTLCKFMSYTENCPAIATWMHNNDRWY